MASNFTIIVYNKSTTLKDQDAQTMCDAMNVLTPVFCRIWGMLAPVVVFLKVNTNVPAVYSSGMVWKFYIIDEDPNVPDALAYHTEEGDKVDGYVLSKTILASGGVPLYKDDQTPTVASALCHEIFEALCDRYVNVYVDDGNGKLWSQEVCDPVQEGIVVVKTTKGITVGLSNFVYPNFFDTELVHGKVDHLSTLSKPFTCAPGGYYVYIDESTGQQQQVFGQMMPDWLKQQKLNKISRVTKRGHKHHHKKSGISKQ